MAVKTKNSSFSGNVMRLAFGNGAASLITLLALPFLMRIFSPDEFGVAAFFASVLGIVGTLACARYEMSIVPSEDDAEAANMFAVSLMFSVVVSGLSIPLVFYGARPLADALNHPEMAALFWFLPPSLLAHGVYTAFSYWNTRKKQYPRLALTQVGGQALNSGGALAGGLIGYVAGSMLILASFLGKAFVALSLGAATLKDDARFFRQHITADAMIKGMKRHKKFFLYGTWSIVLGVGAWQLPILLLGKFFTASVVGFYALGFRILQMPMSLIGGALGQVFFQIASEAKFAGNLPAIVNELFDKLVKLCMLPILILAVIGQDLYVIAFGARWAEAGLYTQILVPWAFFWFLSAPFSLLFSVLERQGMQLVWNIFNFCLRLGAIVIGGLYQDARLAIALLSISGLLLYGFKVFLTLHIAEASMYKAMRTLAINIIIFLPVAAFLLILNALEVDRWISVGCAVLIVAVHSALTLPTFMSDLTKS